MNNPNPNLKKRRSRGGLAKRKAGFQQQQ